MSGGILLALVGLWIIMQVVRGGLVERIGIGS
jgi:hypothetical protein